MTNAGLLDGLPGGVQRWIPVVVVAVAVLPLAALAVRCRAEHHRQAPAVPPNEATTAAVAEVGMVAGTLPWLWMILTPLPHPREVSLVPLVDLAELLRGAPATAFFQIVGNLLVFAAFGFFAPIRWRIRVPVVLAVAAVGSGAVEALQFGLHLGRVSSVDDVLLNAVGAGLAAWGGSRVRRRIVGSAYPAGAGTVTGG